jgi:pantoate--beta-alanine ligase
MGEKDFQQIVVLERMLADLNIDARIVHCPLVRESDGLALSSRNLYLSPDERTRALCLSEALKLGSTAYRDGERDQSVLVSRMRKHIEAHGGEIDYVEIIDPRTLMSTEPVTDDHRIVLAVRMGATRLIDNCRIGSGI